MKNYPWHILTSPTNKASLILFIKSLVFTFIVPGSVAVLIPHLISGEVRLNITYINFLGILFISTGFAIYCSCVWDFIILGKGTPAPIDAPKNLVIKGLYHYTRNPMYVGILLIILGWTLLYTSLPILIYGVLVTLCFHVFILFYEEPKLQQIFDDDYIDYKNKVNRWL